MPCFAEPQAKQHDVDVDAVPLLQVNAGRAHAVAAVDLKGKVPEWMVGEFHDRTS